MIRVPNTEPSRGAISFVQKASASPVLAATQIAKASREEVIARGEMEEAQARLERATANLQASEISYFEAVAKSASNVDDLRFFYNNALAGVREANTAVASAEYRFEQASNALLGLHTLAGNTVAKREFSDKKREALAEKGHALPDGSYPIETEKDLENAIQSYGRAKDPKAVKAHIISRAKDLGATESLPEDWKVKKFAKATEGITMKFNKENGMVEEDLYLCPVCCGACPTTCPCCEGKNDGLVSEERWEMFPAEDDEDFAKSFSTASLLTRDFEKSVGFQTYITKGGANSGRYPRGSKGNGGKGGQANQHTGKLENTRDKDAEGNPVRIGWKARNKNYEKTFASLSKVGREAMRQADKLRAEADRTKDKDTYAKASSLYAEASKSLMKAQGAAKGIEGTLRKYADQGHKDASHDKANEWQEKAADIRSSAYGAKHLAEVCATKAGIA